MGTQNASTYGILSSSLLAALIGTSGLALAQTKASAPAPRAESSKKEDKIDISDLENKYWAPKDTDFSVVQNRTYTKENRWFLTGHFGRPVNDQWSVGNTAGGSVNYFWSERMGVQGTYLQANLSNNEAADFIASHYGSGIYADHNRFHKYMGLGLNIVPFYAKMSFWGKKIIYFDMAISPTIGSTTYEQQTASGSKEKTALTYGVDVTQYFFFTNHFAVRMDLKNQWHKEEIVRFYQSGGIPTGGKVKDQTAQDTLFLMGLTFFY